MTENFNHESDFRPGVYCCPSCREPYFRDLVWKATCLGRAFAGLPAVSAVSAVSDYETAHAAHAAEAPAVSAACSLGGVGEYAHAAETAESEFSA